MAGGHYSDGISEFLIISPVWQIAENSDESDFENFRSSLCRAKGFVAVAVGTDTWNMCFPPPLVHVRSVPCHSTQTKPEPEPKPKLTWLRFFHAEPACRLEIEFVCYSTCQPAVCLSVCLSGCQPAGQIQPVPAARTCNQLPVGICMCNTLKVVQHFPFFLWILPNKTNDF